MSGGVADRLAELPPPLVVTLDQTNPPCPVVPLNGPHQSGVILAYVIKVGAQLPLIKDPPVVTRGVDLPEVGHVNLVKVAVLATQLNPGLLKDEFKR